MGIDLIGLHLRSRIWLTQVLKIEGHIAIVMPQDIIIVDTQQSGLHLIRLAVLSVTTTPGTVIDHVVTTLDTTIEITPEGSQCVVAVALKVEELMPVLVVTDAGATYPEVIAHVLSITSQVVIGTAIPVGPVQRGIGRSTSLAQMLVGHIIFLQRLSGRIRHLQEIVATSGQRYCYHSSAHHFIYLRIHNTSFNVFQL